MPSLGIRKTFVEDGIYHIFNRGVAKQNIFFADSDYQVFLEILSYYLFYPEGNALSNLKRIAKNKKAISELFTKVQPLKNFRPLNLEEMPLRVLAFTLMSNHYHLQIKLFEKGGITNFMRRLGTTYSMYLNKKYDRVGSLFQGIYKAVLVETEAQILHLSRYIHRNTHDLAKVEPLQFMRIYPYSSYKYYLDTENKPKWLDTNVVLDNFRTVKHITSQMRDLLSYQSFVEDYDSDSKKILSSLALD